MDFRARPIPLFCARVKESFPVSAATMVAPLLTLILIAPLRGAMPTPRGGLAFCLW
jgi:hypothetical protein